jgi:hypothetical protein
MSLLSLDPLSGFVDFIRVSDFKRHLAAKPAFSQFSSQHETSFLARPANQWATGLATLEFNGSGVVSENTSFFTPRSQ